MNSEAVSSAGADCFAALDGGEKAEPGVSPAHLIARLRRAIRDIQNGDYKIDDFYQGEIVGLKRAIKIIQASTGR